MVYEDGILNTFRDVSDQEALASPSRAAEGSLWALFKHSLLNQKWPHKPRYCFAQALGSNYQVLVRYQVVYQSKCPKEHTLLLSPFPSLSMFVPRREQVTEPGVSGKEAVCAKLEV